MLWSRILTTLILSSTGSGRALPAGETAVGESFLLRRGGRATAPAPAGPPPPLELQVTYGTPLEYPQGLTDFNVYGTTERLATSWLSPGVLRGVNLGVRQSNFGSLLNSPPSGQLRQQCPEDEMPDLAFREVRPGFYLHIESDVVWGNPFPELSNGGQITTRIQAVDAGGRAQGPPQTLAEMIQDQINTNRHRGQIRLTRTDGNHDCIAINWFVGVAQVCRIHINTDNTINDRPLPLLEGPSCSSAFCGLWNVFGGGKG